MKLLILIGNSAVGKMTVGQELMKITNLRLFHNHMTIEPVIEIFGNYNRVVVEKWREVIFEEFAASNQYGLIFTVMWTFDMKEDWDYMERVCDIFRKNNAEIYFVELVASQKIRLQRNRTENRLENKPSKRNTEFSEKLLLHHDEKHRCESYEGEINFENYIKMDTSNLSAEDTAKQIKDIFSL